MFVWSLVISSVSEGGIVESSRIVFFFLKLKNGGSEYVEEGKD